MATPSDARPSFADEKPPNSVLMVTQPISGDDKETKAEGVKEVSPTSVFMKKEPIREDQVQNAVKFLSHPKVSGSPVIYRRSFLERKGLTKEEIDEAFRRVPDPSPAFTTTPPVVTGQDGQVKSSSNDLQQPSAQVLQSTLGPLLNNPKAGIISRFHWHHAILAVGFLAASVAGTAVLFKKTIIPRLKSWIHKVVSEEDEGDQDKEHIAKTNVAEEAVVAAKTAAAAAADVARASQDMLLVKSEEKKCFEELINMLSLQVHEMKSMSNAIQRLESGASYLEEQATHRVSRTISRPPFANSNADADSWSVRSLSPPAPVKLSVAPHPKWDMEMAMIQRGEKAPNIREINDAPPPDPNPPVSNHRVAPMPKLWESSQTRNTLFNPAQENTSSNYINATHNRDSPSYWQKPSSNITEVETGDEMKFEATNDVAAKRAWVPPQPPPVSMPEAAAAIRQPKKLWNLNDDQPLAQSTGITNELQRITKVSELGGSLDGIIESSTELESSGEFSKENGSYLEA